MNDGRMQYDTDEDDDGFPGRHPTASGAPFFWLLDDNASMRTPATF